MLSFVSKERSLLMLLVWWVVTGIFFPVVSYVMIPIFLLLLQRRKMYLEMLIGFFVILILSDSRQYSFHFAVVFKDVYMVMLVLLMFMDWKSFRPTQRMVFKFLPFLLIAMFFLIFSDIVLTSLQKTLSYLFLVLVVPNYLAYAWKKEGTEALRKIIWIGTLVLVIGFVFRLLQPGFVTLAGRYTGMLGNPNGLGLFCVMFFILVAVGRNMFPDLFSRRESWIINGIILLSIVLSGSRNAVFTIGIFVMFHYFYKISPFLGIFMFIIAVVVYQILLANLASIIYSLNLQEFFRVETLENASGRLIAWDFGWQKISENPFTGQGIGHADNLYKENYDILSIQGHQGNAHNSYITFWLDTGVFGVLAYVIAFCHSFIVGARRYSSAIPAMFAILFSAFFESWLTASLNPFTIQCVIIMTLISSPLFVEQKSEEEEEESETAEEEIEEAEQSDENNLSPEYE